MQFLGLLPFFFRKYKGPTPQVLVIHLDGNDLGVVKGKALVLQVIENLRAIKIWWPEALVIWSKMILRK